MAIEQTTSHDEVEAVFPKVAQTIADTLGRDVDEVTLKARLIEDLEAESIDLLDIVFRLERAFKVKIPRGKIIEDARGELSEAEFVHDGLVTDAGRKRLQGYLNEVPADRFAGPLRLAEIPLLFTVETFCKVVVRGLQKASPST